MRYIRTGIKRQMQRRVFLIPAVIKPERLLFLGSDPRQMGQTDFLIAILEELTDGVNENASLEKMVMGMRVKSDQSTCSVSNGRISSEKRLRGPIFRTLQPSVLEARLQQGHVIYLVISGISEYGTRH